MNKLQTRNCPRLGLLLAPLVAWILASPASACEFGAHLATYHFDRSTKLQEVNPGWFAECGGYTGGAYLNSLAKASAYAGYTAQLGPLGLTAGVVTGYGQLSPLLVGSMKVGAGFRVAVFPPYGGKSGGIHLIRTF